MAVSSDRLVQPDAFAHLVEAHVDAAQRRRRPCAAQGRLGRDVRRATAQHPVGEQRVDGGACLVDAVRDAGQFEQWL